MGIASAASIESHSNDTRDLWARTATAMGARTRAAVSRCEACSPSQRDVARERVEQLGDRPQTLVAWMFGVRARWRPLEQPDHTLRVERTKASGEKEVIFAGFTHLTNVACGMAEFQARAPVAVLEEMPLPWSPPMAYSASDREGLEHWWRQIHYVFDLPDPRLFRPLSETAFDANNSAILGRFVQTTTDLAKSQMLSFDAGFDIRFNTETKEPYIAGANLPGRDIQAGFAVLLRQCLSPKDPANCDAVAKSLDTV